MLHRRTAGFAMMGAALVLPVAARAQSANDLRMMALSAGTASLTSSQMAAQRATNPAVKQFAELEAEEQRAVMQAMQISGISVPQQVAVRQDQAQMMQQMQAMSGMEFDRAFLQMQRQGHQELLQIHSQIARSGQTDAEKAISTLAVPAIKSHLAHIDMLMQMRG